MRSIFVLPLVAICLEKIDVCIWHMFVFVSVAVTVCGNVCCVAAVVKESGLLSLGVFKYVVCLCLPHPVAVSAFIIVSGLCACTEML